MAFRTLHLTSPDMMGKSVGTAQRRLKTNAFKQDYMQGSPVDLDFGRDTAAACVRAHHWLGYPAKAVRGVYGQELDSYLTGKAKLPREYQVRRNKLLKAAATVSIGEKAIKLAYADLGVKESPAGSNRVKFCTRWGFVGPWCNMFVSEKYIDAGSKSIFTIGDRFAFVPYFLNAAYEASYNGLQLVRKEVVRKGDAVCFDWNDDGVADHIGFFLEWIQPMVSFKAIEGNTAAGNNSNGGQVQERERHITDVAMHLGKVAFARVSR